MLVSEMIDQVMSTVNEPDSKMLGNPRTTILRFISDVQRDYATRTWRFEKRERTTSVITGGEEAQGKFTLSSLHYEFVGLKGVQFDGYPLPIRTFKSYMAALAKNSGTAQYGTPYFAWLYGHAVRVWPIPDEAKTVRLFWAAKPKALSAETETLVIRNTGAILAGTRRMVYEVLKDTERAVACWREYENQVKADNDKPQVLDEDFSAHANVDDMEGEAYFTVGGEMFR